jgi:hypothetical protein
MVQKNACYLKRCSCYFRFRILLNCTDHKDHLAAWGQRAIRCPHRLGFPFSCASIGRGATRMPPAGPAPVRPRGLVAVPGLYSIRCIPIMKTQIKKQQGGHWHHLPSSSSSSMPRNCSSTVSRLSTISRARTAGSGRLSESSRLSSFS